MILIIDDDIAVRASLLLLLNDGGFDALGCAGPVEAMKLIKKQEPELIILDLNFSNDTSGKEGMELLNKIKQGNPALPIILITGWASIELAVQGMKAGANDFINKPWSNEHLLQSVKTLLELRGKKTQAQTRKQLDKTYNFQQIIGE
ncbi:MAG TPA: response regulator, partial [Mucilaginibacter sp.]|nr:response regulator [Mucilaginibacter sp.]